MRKHTHRAASGIQVSDNLTVHITHTETKVDQAERPSILVINLARAATESSQGRPSAGPPNYRRCVNHL
jgi:hypothetical protein